MVGGHRVGGYLESLEEIHCVIFCFWWLFYRLFCRMDCYSLFLSQGSCILQINQQGKDEFVGNYPKITRINFIDIHSFSWINQVHLMFSSSRKSSEHSVAIEGKVFPTVLAQTTVKWSRLDMFHLMSIIRWNRSFFRRISAPAFWSLTMVCDEGGNFEL